MKKYDWDNYLIIESEFIEAGKYLSFERAENLEADSPFLQNEIVLLGAKVEMAMKKLISFRNKDKSFSPYNISDYKRILLVMFPQLETYKTVLIRYDYPFIPFKDWSKKKLPWWETYSGIKHGSSEIPKLKYALDLLAAYQILLFLIHYEEQRDGEYVFYTLGEMPKLLDIQFDKETIIFGTIGFGFPREQIKECNDKAIEKVIALIKQETKEKA